MTFDEWVTASDLDYLRGRDHEAVLIHARSAWDAGTIAERERCAAVADSIQAIARTEDWPGGTAAAEIATRIRAGLPDGGAEAATIYTAALGSTRLGGE